MKDLIGPECWVFIDDLVIFSRSEHALRLEHVLERLEKANLQLNPGKCEFAQPRVQYLGYVLPENGVSASADKVKAVRVSDPEERQRRSRIPGPGIILQAARSELCRNGEAPNIFD
jgi:hypothetical protein